MNLPELLAVLRRRRWVFVLCVLAGCAGGLVHARTAAKAYSATSRCVLSIPAGQTVQDVLAGAQLSRTLLATYAEVATSREVAQRVVTSLRLPETAGSLRGRLSATAQENTFLIDVSARDSDPRRAASIADATALALSAQVAALEVGKADPVQVQLLDRAAAPGAPFTPRPRRDLLVGLLLGLLGGTALAFALEALDRSIKLPTQGSALFGAPLLGVVPRRRGGLGLVAATERAGVEAEAIRAIRTSVRFLDPDHPLHVLLVTSATPSDGKTSVAANLAISIADGGERVVIVDADLRRATLTEVFGLERAVGLSSVVVGEAALEDALTEWAPNVDVLPAGPHPPNPAEILGSQSMAQLLDRLSTAYDLVLLDGPPILPVTDPVVLATQVDGVIMVARYGKTPRVGAAEGTRRLAAVGGRVVGYVLNGVPPNESQAYYASYGPPPPRKRAAHAAGSIETTPTVSDQREASGA